MAVRAALAAAVLASALTRTAAHSWVACTDYTVADPTSAPKGPSDPDPARSLYDESKCRAYARDYTNYWNPVFGADTGYDYNQATVSGNACLTQRNGAADYTAARPKAVYAPGQTVCLAYPAKNHVADDRCTNIYIPDTDFKIYRSGVNPTIDPTLDQFKTNGVPHYNGVHQDGVVDYKGFQNCPGFCDASKGGTGFATCTVCFTLESDLAAGEYTFLWYWLFNDNNLPYTSCWEATVTDSAVTTPKTTPVVTRKATTTTPTAPVATVPPGSNNCFCPCTCSGGCWHRCACSTAGSQVNDPFKKKGKTPRPTSTPKTHKPTAKATPKPTAKKTTTPTPTAKATPKPTAKKTTTPTPTAKATPKPTPKKTTASKTQAPTVKPTTPTPTGKSTCVGSPLSAWSQCGGIKYSGSTCCASGNKCTYLNDWYYQCIPV